MSTFDDLMGSSSFKKPSFYSAEDIDKAKKRMNKFGGTLLENLRIVTGRDASYSMDLQQEISSLNENLMKDFGALSQMNLENAKAVANLSGSTQNPEAAAYANVFSDFGLMHGSAAAVSEEAPREERAAVELDSFNDIAPRVEEKIFGQEEFLKQLVIAFKRPFVMPEKEGFPRNSLYVTGPEDSGKHTALRITVEELYRKDILRNPEITVIDLSLYPNSGNDKVFLQDLYMALQKRSEVILFENFDACHISYLTYLIELVTEGRCMLSERYILQKGQLVNVNTSFASEAVSSFSAQGKYLVFISTKSVDKLAGALGAPFVNALGDVCSTEALDEESLRKVSRVRLKDLKEKAESRFSFKLTGAVSAFVENSLQYAGKGAGLTGILRFYDSLERSLANLRLEGSYEKDAELELAVENGRVLARIGQDSIDLLASLPGGYQGELEKVKAEMSEIVGLKKIKEYIFSLEEYYAVQKKRREEGLKVSEVSKHMIFTGSPGTGKTTIARIISRYLKAIGVLTGGQLVEVSRADLVGRYVGHTAPLTNQVLQSAIGGVLFIDEAYSLYRGKDDSFGLEAIDTLVKGIEDNRDNLIVILAGYSKEMKEFLTANSGLESRFPNVIEFPDYTGQELLDIAKITAKSKGYVIDEGAEISLLTYFNFVQATRSATAGNGRLVRNKIEEAILNQSRRLVAEPDADLSLLTSRDFDLSDVDPLVNPAAGISADTPPVNPAAGISADMPSVNPASDILADTPPLNPLPSDEQPVSDAPSAE